MKYFQVTLVLFALSVSVAFADNVSFSIDAGNLRGYAPSGVPAGMPEGGLVLLISNTGEGTTFLPAAAGDYVTGDDSIIAAFSMNYVGVSGSYDTQNVTVPAIDYGALALGGTMAGGDDLAIRWFPDITYAEFESGTTPVAGDYYGTYSAGDTNPDGGDVWVVPPEIGGGQTWELAFYTSDDGGGSQPESAGYASSQIAAVPEPGILTMLAVPMATGAMFLRRRRRRS